MDHQILNNSYLQQRNEEEILGFLALKNGLMEEEKKD